MISEIFNISIDERAQEDIFWVEKENDYEPNLCTKRHCLLKFHGEERAQKEVFEVINVIHSCSTADHN